MEINTRYHGVKQYNTEDIINFHKGLPGFDGLTKFILFPVEEKSEFYVLHSIEDEEIGLIVVSPFSLMEDYEFEIDENVVSELKITDTKNVFVYTTVSVHSQREKVTTNLKAPIVVNNENNLGEQIILDDEKYIMKYPLFQE